MRGILGGGVLILVNSTADVDRLEAEIGADRADEGSLNLETATSNYRDHSLWR